MAIAYQITEQDGVHSLVNKSSTQFTYSVSLLDSFGNVGTAFITNFLAAGECAKIDLRMRPDGFYSIVLAENLSTKNILISHSRNLLKDLVANVQEIVCDCNCENCEECEECAEVVTNLSSVLKANYHYISNIAFYKPFMEVVFTALKGVLNESVYYMLSKEMIRGISDTASLTKKKLAFYYLVFYFAEFRITPLEERANLAQKYNTAIILPCISKMGVNIVAIQKAIELVPSSVVTSAHYINRPPTALFNTTLIIPNQSEVTLAILDFISSYSDPDGDPIYKIRIDSVPDPQKGRLEFNGVLVIPGQEILASDIDLGKLIYTSPVSLLDSTDEYDFSISDFGSQQFIT